MMGLGRDRTVPASPPVCAATTTATESTKYGPALWNRNVRAIYLEPSKKRAAARNWVYDTVMTKRTTDRSGTNDATLRAVFRGRQTLLGYWISMDSPAATERVGRLPYDFLCLDAQHGLIDDAGLRSGVAAADASGTDVLVRVVENGSTPIGRALDIGAKGIIVPLVDTRDEAAAAVASAKYPPNGHRSYGPTRSCLRIGPGPAEANAATIVVVMIETGDGLSNVEDICSVNELDGIFVGPSDLSLSLGASEPGDPAVAEEFAAALARITHAAEEANISAGIYVPDGTTAATRLDEGFTFAIIANDLEHLEIAAAGHLDRAQDTKHIS